MKIDRAAIIRLIVMIMLGLVFPLFTSLDQVGGKSLYWLKAFYSFLFAFAIYEGDFRIVKFFRNKYPDISQTRVRTIASMASTSGYTLCVVFVGFWLLTLSYGESMSVYPVTQVMLIALFVSMVIGAIYESSYFSGRWKQTVIEAERLKGEKVSSEYEILKQQVNPDFLFKSLQVIEELIESEESQALDYTEKLSQTYRYILQQRDEELIDLKTEIDYVQKYLSLLQKQLAQPLPIQWQIDSEVEHKRIIPFSLQYILSPILANSTQRLSQVIIFYKPDQLLGIRIQGTGWFELIQETLPPLQKKYAYLTNQQLDITATSEEEIEIWLPLLDTQIQV
ncbi:hypothetical protein BKI52_04915 [marine bacterium AO1-C]|nr:hypothetical protein BKI52_04915 [marine bacterium AO1-C]